MKSLRYLLLLTVFVCFAGSAYAQDMQEQKKKESVFPDQDPLPEAGDIALGFDAVPFLEYLGNFLNGTQNNSVNADFVGNRQQIFAKYFLTDDMAIRGRLSVRENANVDRDRAILDNQSTPDPNVQVTDERKFHNNGVEIGGGLEFRRGSGRLYGVYGAEVAFTYRSQNTNYDYGNPISQSNQSPSTSGIGNTQVVSGRFERQTERKQNKQLGVGLNGFIGVEYFFTPKISLGAEFTLGAGFLKDYRDQSTYEFWNNQTNSVDSRNIIQEGGRNTTLETGNYGGSINVMFYF